MLRLAFSQRGCSDVDVEISLRGASARAIPGALPLATMQLACGQHARGRAAGGGSSCEFIFLPHLFLPIIRFPRITPHRLNRVTSELRADTGRNLGSWGECRRVPQDKLRLAFSQRGHVGVRGGGAVEIALRFARACDSRGVAPGYDEVGLRPTRVQPTCVVVPTPRLAQLCERVVGRLLHLPASSSFCRTSSCP